MKKIFYTLSAVLLASVFGACDPSLQTPEEEQKMKSDEELAEYLSKNNIEAQKDESGFYFEPVTTKPEGMEILPEYLVELHYKIETTEGVKIGDNLDQSPVMVKYNVQQFLPVGIDMGLSKMKVGETYRFYIPSYLAYWDFYTDELAQFSNVIAEVTLEDAYTEESFQLARQDTLKKYALEYLEENKEMYNLTSDSLHTTSSGLHYIIVEQGEGKQIKEGFRVSVHYSGRFLNGEKFDSSYDRGSPFFFVAGRGEVIAGWDELITKLRRGTKAKVFIPYHLAYGAKMRVLPAKYGQKDNIPPFKDLTFFINVLDN